MPQPFVWEPSAGQIATANVTAFMQQLGFSDREAFLRFAADQPETFWPALEQALDVRWYRRYDQVVDLSRGPEWATWFHHGLINITHNCLDRHVSDHAAVVWEGEDGSTRTLTFHELQADVNRLANALHHLNLRQQDRVALVMPMVPEVATILYACLKLGLIVVPIFSGFGPAAIQSRLADSGARLVFTADAMRRRGKRIPLKEKVDGCLAGTAVEHVVVLRYQGGDMPWHAGRDHWWHDVLAQQPDTAATVELPSEAPALLLYTSGTTGRPKGTVHTHAGTLVQTAKEIFLGFDHKPTDRFWWLSDIGWMMGPWTLIGNHHLGGTVFLYDGAPDHPGPDRLWRLIERHRITTFGVSPTAIRLLRKHEPQQDLSSLRLLGSTGEPWDESSWLWFFERIGGRRCPIINISGGTEIIGCFLFPLPIQPLKPTTLGGPAPGMAVAVVDEQGAPVRGRLGHLICTRPAPSMTRGIWGQPERYLNTYWRRMPGVWYHGDWASVDEDGLWYLHGRTDDALNVAGRKVGPGEVESVLCGHPAVAESAVIGVPDEVTGEAIVAFVVPRQPVSPDALAGHVAREMGSAFKPRSVHTVPELPKTQSGKVVRRLIRQRYLNEPLGDTSTVENPAALEHFARG